MTRFKIRFTTVVAAVAVITLLRAVDAQTDKLTDKQNTEGLAMRIGTFDSRALAMAYYRSDTFREHMKELHAQHEKAKADGNEQLVKKLDAEGPALQELVHKQGFGTWPVDNLLNKIKDEIPRIAEQAQVDIIISKWNIVYRKPDAQFVDVTDLMVKPFAPDEATLKVIKQIREKQPVPVEDLKRHDH